MNKAELETEKELGKLARKLRGMYRTAGKEVKSKAEAYFQQFMKADADIRDGLKTGRYKPPQGETAESYYQKWRTNRFMMGERWERLKAEMSYRMYTANDAAAAYINGTTPGIYKINYESSVDEITSAAVRYSFEMSFSIVNERTIKALTEQKIVGSAIVDEGKDIKWNSTRIQNALKQGILQGETGTQIAKRFQNIMHSDYKTALANAKMYITRAQNAGKMETFRQASEMGIVFKKWWKTMGDSRVRDIHVQAGLDYGAENAIPVDAPFVVGGERMMYPTDASLGASAKNLHGCRCQLMRTGLDFKPILKKRGKIKMTDEKTGEVKYI